MELRARVRSLLKVKAYNDHMANYQKELEAEVARRTEQVREAHAKLRDASLETIFRLARAAEYKDEDTGAHLISMSRISAYLAERLGLNQTVVDRILYASPMHDIGKIGIPDRILTKNGPLNDEEWGIMRMHPIFGGQILEGSDIGFLSLGEVISLTHHEKWDGSGYPHGLAGTQIPLAGRIVAVADVFDALRSKRPYKPPLTMEQTVDIIRAGRGTHFDPQVVDILLDNLDGVVKLWDEAQASHHAGLQQSSLNPDPIHA
ncbi:MAG: HD domain-containing protein, partial [Candidatus Adiutrix sp.]|jgi:putative two-component system response regulator|nr:HD domain-containing protein [Candidatus Adiutrix sp.]